MVGARRSGVIRSRSSGGAWLAAMVLGVGCGGGASEATFLPSSAEQAPKDPATSGENSFEGDGFLDPEAVPTPPQPADAQSVLQSQELDPSHASLAPERTPLGAPGALTNPAALALVERCSQGRPSLRFYDVVHEPSDAPSWRGAVRDYYRCVLGLEQHTAAALELSVEQVVQVTPRVRRLKVWYNAGETFQGQVLRVPAYLFVPETRGRVPAVIVYHGHGPGKANVAEGEGTTENALGRYLAERYGYVVLAPDTRTFGEFTLPGVDHATYYGALQQDPTAFFQARVQRDGYQDMALLASLEEVNPEAIGVAGVSMGAWRALGHSLLHDRVRATVVSGLYIPFEYLFSDGHDACQRVPPLAARLEMEDLGPALAPRGLMVQWGLWDWFYGDGAPSAYYHARTMFQVMGAEEAFVVELNPGVGHQFNRPGIGAFLRQRLGAGAWDP